MRLIADTHALIWWWTGKNERLSQRAVGLLSDGDNTVFVSAASAWEIATKHRIGKLVDLADPLRMVPVMSSVSGFVALTISQAHALLAGSMAGGHGDPFDRMLAAQAIVEDVAILSIDTRLDAFGCRRLWD